MAFQVTELLFYVLKLVCQNKKKMIGSGSVYMAYAVSQESIWRKKKDCGDEVIKPNQLTYYYDYFFIKLKWNQLPSIFHKICPCLLQFWDSLKFNWNIVDRCSGEFQQKWNNVNTFK